MTMANPTVVLTLAYNAQFEIDAKDVSAALAIFAKARRIDDRYVNGKTVYVLQDDAPVTVQAGGFAILTKAEYEAQREAETKAREERERVEREEAERV
jgi:hypothetical protein